MLTLVQVTDPILEDLAHPHSTSTTSFSLFFIIFLYCREKFNNFLHLPAQPPLAHHSIQKIPIVTANRNFKKICYKVNLCYQG